jgi:ABC-type multidrug transport system permease subunit
MDLQSRLLQAVVRFTKGLATADTANREWDADSKAALKTALDRPQALTVTRRTSRTLRPPPTGISQSLPGMLVMFAVQMILTFGGAALVKDRNGGQLARLFAGPLNAFEIYSGKILARVVLAIFQAVVLLVGGSLLFKMPLGDHPLLLLPVVVSLSLFAGCLSILGGVICRTEKQVSLGAVFGSMFLAALGGCWWPIEIVPDFFQTVAKFTPNYWGIHGLQSILYFGRSYEVLTFECPILLGFAALAGGLAMLATRRLGQGKNAAGK